jgi:hypothetical protein
VGDGRPRPDRLSRAVENQEHHPVDGVAALPVREPLLEVAPTIPYAAAPTTLTAATMAIDLVSLRKNIGKVPFVGATTFATRPTSLRRGTLRHISHPAIRPRDVGPRQTRPSDRLASLAAQAVLPLCALIVVVRILGTSRWLISAAPPG